MNAEELRKLPKVELHCHLDGSLSREFIESRLHRTVTEEQLRVSEDCKSLNEYLEKFTLPGLCLRDEEGLEGAGYDLLRTMSREHVCYGEIRFAPLLSVTEEMGTAQVLQALLKGLERGKRDFGTAYNVIVCAMRHHREEENLAMIKESCKFLGKGVCAADLAGAEALYPMEGFMGLFQKVRELGMPFTIHAGECGNVENIIAAVEAGAGRIGHGIAMRGDKRVQRLVAEKGLAVEMCPISNLQTKAAESPGQYPLREFLEAGIPVTINTDNRTVSNTSMTKELAFIQETYGIRDEEILQMMINAGKAAFAPEQVKEEICQRLEEAWKLV